VFDVCQFRRLPIVCFVDKRPAALCPNCRWWSRCTGIYVSVVNGIVQTLNICSFFRQTPFLSVIVIWSLYTLHVIEIPV